MVRRVSPFILLTFAILFPTLPSLHAQDKAEADTLPVVEPQDVLAEGVEVIETLPELNADYVNDVLYYLAPDTDRWELLPPPAGLSGSGYMTTDRLQHGNFAVYEMPSDMAGSCPSPTPTFEFDPATHQFTQQPEETSTPDPSSYWSLFYSSPPENIKVRNYCELDTFGAEMPADMSDLIRAGIENGGQYDGPYPTEMHIPNYLIVASPLPDDDGNYRFAVYATETDRWSVSIPLALPGEWAFRSLGYQDDMLYIEARGEAGIIFYRLDVAQKAFKKLFQTSYPQSVHSGRNDVYYYLGHDTTDYQFYQYDLFSEHETVIAELRCDAITGNCTDLTIRDTNQWSHNPDLMVVIQGAETADGIPYYVVDIPNAGVLHKGILPAASYLTWLDTRPSLLISSYKNASEQFAILVDLSADNSAETQIVIPYWVSDISPDEQRAVVYLDDETAHTQTIGIVDLQTLVFKPVTLPLDTNVYDIGVYWRTDATLELTIYAHDYDFRWVYAPELRTWIIRAP